MISVIIPTYNEEKYLPETLAALAAALKDEDAEVIVVDNGSTDATRSIAESFGARIATEPVRNIGQVRNAGARAAKGDVLVFLDADTAVLPGLFERISEAMADPRCSGGAAAVRYREPETRRFFLSMFMWLWTVLGRWSRMRQGALQFCRPEVFREMGGYDPGIYVGEDIEFHWRLERLARGSGGCTAFVEGPFVETSSRRWEKMGLLRMILLTHPVTIFLLWRVGAVWRDWYRDAVR
jgi:glycosyltransferase involved in cell wall biosynthesis